MVKRKMPKCMDCKKSAVITWDGIWLCKSCEKKRLKKYLNGVENED